MRTLTIGQNDAGQRLDKFLTKALPRMPKSLLYKSIRIKKIKVNRRRATPEQILVAGDELQLFLAEDLFDKTGDADTGAERARSRGDLPILYEDGNLILLDKRPGVTVHEDENGSADTLL
ncbi:MAG: RluA family pseudouridine synthase, partial [Clostridia bacterium]|nr:RluA family pseudouridine synthase [Clostridia bacterium]